MHALKTPPTGSRPARGAPPPAASEPDAFSALHLRDRVAIMLLFDQIVTEEQVARVWATWQRENAGTPKERESFWRRFAEEPDIDRNLVFAEAARVYGIEEARIMRRVAVPLIEKVARLVPAPVWDELAELRVVPVAEGEQNHSHRQRLIFASHDPMHSRVQALLPSLGLAGYELRYAPEFEIVELLAEAFPWKFKSAYEALVARRKQAERRARETAAQAAEEAPAPPAEDTPDAFDAVAPTEGVNSSSIIAFFEDLLVKAVQHKATGICLVPSDSTTEVYFQVGEALDPWRVVDHIHPEALLATLKGAILKGPLTPSDEHRYVIKRWIDGALVRFRISALPSGEAADQESVLIRVLG